MFRYFICVLFLSLSFIPPVYPDKSFNSLKERAEQGNADAQYSLGSMYLLGLNVPRDYTEAMKWYHKAAEQGNADAQFDLGGMYYKGKGAPHNFSEAMKWYRKAAEQGYAKGQFNLGNIYREGQVVPQDYTEALQWYHKAAEQGYTYAQFKLGSMYSKGEGVPKDYITAYAWFNIAATNGLREAVEPRSVLVDSMTPQQIADGQKLMRELIKTIKPATDDQPQPVKATPDVAQ